MTLQTFIISFVTGAIVGILHNVITAYVKKKLNQVKIHYSFDTGNYCKKTKGFYPFIKYYNFKRKKWCHRKDYDNNLTEYVVRREEMVKQHIEDQIQC